MVITLGPDLEAALNDLAVKHAVAPEALALAALRERFLGQVLQIQPRGEWERLLLEAATDCGVSLPDEALRREQLYE